MCASETARGSEAIETPGATTSERGLSVWESGSANGRVGGGERVRDRDWSIGDGERDGMAGDVRGLTQCMCL